MLPPAGYSGTPLTKKLGIKPRFRAMVINEPGHYLDLFDDMPVDVVFSNNENELKDLIHFFIKSKAGYMRLLPRLKMQIVLNGTIWVSWPKKAAKITTDITEDIIRNYALETGLVDVKVCAVDELWSGLKLVLRLKDRTALLNPPR